jgi:hypothetical protein
MSQEEILEVLEQENRPLSRQEICRKLDDCGPKVSHLINKLIKHNEVKFFEIDRETAKNIFGSKAPLRRMKLYYIPKRK